MSALGWCAKAVDSLADRLVFREFKNDNFGINEIFRMNNPDILFDSAVLSAMISSCCFIYISKDEDDYPQLQVIDGGNATGVMNPITGLLNEGYAVLDRDENGSPILEAYLKAGSTEYHQKGQKPWVIPNDAPAPLLVPNCVHCRMQSGCLVIRGSAERVCQSQDPHSEQPKDPKLQRNFSLFHRNI